MHFKQINLYPSEHECDCQSGYGLNCTESCLYNSFQLHSYCLDGIYGNGSFNCYQPYFINKSSNLKIPLNCQLNRSNNQNNIIPNTYNIDCPCLLSSNYVQYNNHTGLCECKNNSLSYGINCTKTCSLCSGSYTICNSGHELANGEYLCIKPFIQLF